MQAQTLTLGSIIDLNGCGKESKSTFFKVGHITYKSKGHEVQNNMQK